MGRNEGEGDKTAARRYNKATTAFARSGRVAAVARKAETAIAGAEGVSLRKAEQVGRAKARGGANGRATAAKTNPGSRASR